MEKTAGCGFVLRFRWGEERYFEHEEAGWWIPHAAAIKKVEKDEALVIVRHLRHRLARRTRGESMLWRGS